MDLSHEQLHMARATITMPDLYTPMDFLLPDPTPSTWSKGGARASRTMARASDITLPDAHISLPDGDIPPLMAPERTDVFLDEAEAASFDLGLDLDDLSHGASTTPQRRAPPAKKARRDTSRYTLPEPSPAPEMDDSFASVGVARHAPLVDSASAHVQALVGDVSADVSMDALPDLPPLDDPMPMAGTPPRRATPSPPPPALASTPSRALTLHDVAHAQLTPRTAAKLRSAAEMRMSLAHAAPKAPRKRPIQDDITEWAPARARSLQARAATATVTMSTQAHEKHCLPASRIQLALWATPTPKRLVASMLTRTWGTVLSDMDKVCAPTLEVRRRCLDARPSDAHMQTWLREIHEQAQAQCKDDDYSMEMARRASEPPAWLAPIEAADDSMALDLPKPVNDGFDVTETSLPALDVDMPDLAPLDEAPLNEAPLDEAVPPRRSLRHGRPSSEMPETGRLAPLSRLATPDLDTDDVLVDVPLSNPIAAFDTHAPETSTDGWDVRTKRAAHVLRTVLDRHDEPSVSFQAVSQHATRRAAAGFFFEMLVLGTRDCVRLSQPQPYGDIHVEATPSLASV
ncbi:mitotic cohesin complex protein [Malassezia pachydermatis]